MKFVILLVVLANSVVFIRASDGVDSEPEAPQLMEDIMGKYTSAFGDLKGVPPSMLRQAMKHAIPKIQEELVDYSTTMYAAGKGVEGYKPNPMLLGFAMGLKTWSEHMSNFMPLLQEAVYEDVYEEEDDDSLCLYEEDICYEDDVVTDYHCFINVTCPY